MESAELLERFENEITAFVQGSNGNYVSMRAALSPSASGLKLFEEPIFGVASADDPLFAELGKTNPERPQLRLPSDWLPSAASVISYFLPMTELVRNSNREGDVGSPEWLHVKTDGRMFIMRLGEQMERVVRAAGYEVVCPACYSDSGKLDGGSRSSIYHCVGWSERLVAYICGLGTLSLSRNFITEKGCAGMLGSLIVSAKLPATKRPYSEIDEYCTKCGACVDRCPAGAISLESGKDARACHVYKKSTNLDFPGYVGCGKCQVCVPCESSRPA